MSCQQALFSLRCTFQHCDFTAPQFHLPASEVVMVWPTKNSQEKDSCFVTGLTYSLFGRSFWGEILLTSKNPRFFLRWSIEVQVVRVQWKMFTLGQCQVSLSLARLACFFKASRSYRALHVPAAMGVWYAQTRTNCRMGDWHKRQDCRDSLVHSTQKNRNGRWFASGSIHPDFNIAPWYQALQAGLLGTGTLQVPRSRWSFCTLVPNYGRISNRKHQESEGNPQPKGLIFQVVKYFQNSMQT